MADLSKEWAEASPLESEWEAAKPVKASAPQTQKTYADMQRDFANSEGTKQTAARYGKPQDELQREFATRQGTAKTARQYGVGSEEIDGVPRWGREHPNLFALSKTVAGGIDFSKPTEVPVSLADFATRVVPESAVKTGAAVVTAPYHMIKNVTDPVVEYAFNLGNPNSGNSLAKGLDRGMGENVKSLADFMAAPLGYKRDENGGTWSLENAANQWSTDPVGSALAFIPTAKLAKKSGGAAVDLSLKQFGPEPTSLARSALKPYIGESAARQKQVAKGLETAVDDPNASPHMNKFLENNLREMEEIGGRQEVLFDQKGNPHVSIGPIRDALQRTVDEARETPGTSESVISATEKVLNDITNHKEYNAATDSLPLNTIGNMKKRIWRTLREKGTFNTDNVAGLQDAMWDAAGGMNEVINTHIPEMAGENARYGELANVNKLLKRAIDRHANNNIIPLRALIQLVRGDARGFASAASMWALDHPTFKLYVAQRIAKVKGRAATPAEVNSAIGGIQQDLVQRDQTVLDSESLPKVSNDTLGDTITGGYQQTYDWSGKPAGAPEVANPEALPPRSVATNFGDELRPYDYAPEYGWEGKQAAPMVANPETLPPPQSSQMPQLSEQGGRIVPHVEAMTPRVPEGFNPEVIGMGTEDVQLGDRIAPKPRPLRDVPEDGGNGGPQPPPDGGIPPAGTPPVSRAAAPVQPIADLIAERRALRGENAPVSRAAAQPQPIGEMVAERRELHEQPYQSRAAAPVQSIGELVAELRGLKPQQKVAESAPAVEGRIPDIRPNGWEARGDVVDTFTRKGKLYRGMTQEEYEATVGRGAGIKSRQDYSVDGEGTSFSDNAADAESYVNYGRHDPRKTGKPTYLIEVDAGPDVKLDRDGYYKAADAIPNNRITRVIKMDAEDGAVVGYDQPLNSNPPSRAASPAMSLSELVAERRGLHKGVEKRNGPELPNSSSSSEVPNNSETLPEGIYKTRVKVGDTIEERYAVTAPESLGFKRGHGDELYRTLDEAKQAQEFQTKRETARAKAEQERIASEEVAKQAEEKSRAEREDIDGFDAGLTPLQRGKVVAALTQRIRRNGVEMSRRDAIRQMVKDGYTLGEWKGERTLQDKDGAFFTQGQLSKTALDYAEHLLNRESSPSPAQEAAAKGAKSDPLGIRKGGKK